MVRDPSKAHPALASITNRAEAPEIAMCHLIASLVLVVLLAPGARA